MKFERDTVPARPAWAVFPELAPAGESAQQRFEHKLPKEIPAGIRAKGNTHAAVMSFSNMTDYGDLLVKYFRARKDVFIDRLSWDLPQTDGMEFDQYDTPRCRWVVIHEFGEVLAGIRLVPTTAQCGCYSYMLRDGQRGLLDDFPTDVLFFDAPVSRDLWEASRLFITDAVPAQRRVQVQVLLMRNMILTAAELNAHHVIGIVPAVWSRWLRRLGLYAVPVGPRFRIGDISSQAALFSIADQLEWALSDAAENAV